VEGSDADQPRDGDAVPARAPLNQASFLLALAITTGAMLALEVLDTRVLSVLTWYSLGFLVIGMGLFGLTAGAVDVYLRPAPWQPASLGTSLCRDGIRFAYSIAASAMLLLVIPLRVELLLTTLVAFLVFASAIALPFFFAGRIVAAALTRTRFPPGRVYAADLVGAAMGAPLVVLLLDQLDGTSACIFVGAIAALGAALFAHSAGDRLARRRGLFVAALLALLSIANGATDRGLRPLWIKGRAESRDHIERELWNSHSRVQLLRRAKVPAAMWGMGGRCKPPSILQQGMEIDGHAATPIYLVGRDLEALRFLECDVTNVAHQLRKGGDVAIIGVGGSRDVQAALLAGHKRIVGIELNGRLLEILDGPLGAETGIRGRPEVELVHDEARSYLTRDNDRYDLIQASLIDTWAATGAGAHALSENGLYTVEAIQLFLDRLKPGGLLSVSRWASVETARLTSVVHAALLSRGVARPRDHLAIVAAGPVATVIVGRDALSAQDLAALGQISRDKGFLPVVAPGHPALVPRIEGLLSATSREDLDRRALSPKHRRAALLFQRGAPRRGAQSAKRGHPRQHRR
jgi:SAM-dependent methyltransferase